MPVQPGEPECDVKLIIIHPHVHLRSGVETVLSYLGNAGRMLLFYPVAPPPRIKALAVVECQSSFYILRMKADANANIPMKATMTYGMGLETPVTPHANSTIDIEIILGETSP